ncbi:PAS domain S-box protein [Edaphobacter sp. HDX4]|uniref:PAS domain S-box protein n=1 Tax=Edaphobacter sp. HDX4 TaxID=2794064 RepID=UPI002FE5E464
MRWDHVGKPLFRLLAGVATVFAITIALYAAPLHARSLTASLTYLVVVLIVAAFWGVRDAVFVSFLAALGFIWMLPPVGSFRLDDSRDFSAIPAFLFIGITAGYFSERARSEALNAKRRRAEAVAAQERYRGLVNSVEAIVWEADASTFAFLFVSEQAERILGYPVEAWLAEPAFWTNHLHHEDRNLAAHFCEQTKASGQKQDFEYRMIAADGRVVWLRGVVAFVVENGHPSRLRGVMIDITERKQAEQARQEIEEQWKAAFESNPTMYFIIDAAGMIVSVNGFGAEQLGYCVDELIGQPVLNVFYEPDRQSVQGYANACFEQPGQMKRWEARKIRKDGTMLWVRETANAVFLKKRPVLLVVCENITEQKRAEDAARHSEKELRDAIESVPAMLFIALPGPSNVFVSRGWREYTGLTSEDTAGFGWQSAVHPEDMEKFLEKWRVCSATGEPFEDETRFRRATDGEYRWFLIRAVSLRDEYGNILKWYGVLTDIEDRKRADEAVRKSEMHLRDVIDTIPTIAWTALPNGNIDFVNRSWQEYLQISLNDTSGAGWETSIHPNDISSNLERWQASLSSGKPFETESRVKRARDGEYRWLLHRAVPFRDDNNNILKWYGISTDIEDRKRAEALLTGEKRILEMVAKGDSLAQILDSLCRLVEEQASGVLASVLLVDGNHLRHGGAPSLPKTYTDAIDGVEIGPTVGSCGTAAYRGEQVIVADITTDPLWAEFRGAALPHSLRACWSTPVFSSQGKVIATFAMYYREPRSPSTHDQEIIEQITHLAGVAIERKLTQEALRRNEAYLAEAQRLTRTGSWAYNPFTGKTVYWSEEMFHIFGLDPQEGPSSEKFWQLVHPEDLDRVRVRVEREAQDQKEYVDEYRIVLPDGNLKHILDIGHPVFDEAGGVVEFVGTAVDVTERKHAEQERERLRQIEEDLAHMNRVSMMGELAASLAHEIKQPITAAATNAKTSLRWLHREPPEIGNARDAVSRVVKDVIRAADIIDRNRSLYSRDTPKREPVNLNDLIREMTMLLHDAAGRHSTSIRVDLDRALPTTIADRVQMQQVLMNLMLNGIEAMTNTGGELTIRSKLAEDGQLVISVRDMGIGLPTENTERIFDAFFTTKAQGTGMGLSIGRRIIEAHAGRLWACANVGRGSTFYFALPADLATPSSPSGA